MSVKTYAGSCRCGNVRFEADIDFADGKTGKCNCTMCSKTRNWSKIIKPDAFRLLSDPAATTDYTSNGGITHWPFCKTCGVRAYGTGDIPEAGGPYVSVSIACLDNLGDAEKAALPVGYANGRDNDWWHEPAVTAHL